MKDNKIKKPRILIVDDQLFNINALKIILNHGINIDTETLCHKALSDNQALEMIKENVELNIS